MQKILSVTRFLVLAFELGCTDDPVACDAGDGGECGVTPPPSDVPIGFDAGPPMLMVATSGIYVTPMPVPPERSVEGDVLVRYGEMDALGATVQINGVTLSPSMLGGGLFDVGPETGLAPGSHVVMTASFTDAGGTHEASVEFDCPATVLTAPAAGTFFRSGDTAMLTWTPAIEFESVFGPAAGIYACFTRPTGDEVTMFGHGDWFIDLTAGQTNVGVPIEADCARYVLEVRSVGETIVNRGSVGMCYSQPRVTAVGPSPG